MEKLYTLLAEVSFNENQLNVPKTPATGSQVETILRLVFIIAGVVCVIVITIAGLNYVLSSGDPQKVSKAKDTILYAVIGLAVSILAFAIVSFVLGKIFG